MLRDELDSILAGQDLLRDIVRNSQHKLLLQGHDKLNSVEGIEAKVVNEVAVGLDLYEMVSSTQRLLG